MRTPRVSDSSSTPSTSTLQPRNLRANALRYACAAQKDERDHFPYTAAMEWRQAAELFDAKTLFAEYCWRQWERIMRLPRRFAVPISDSHTTIVAAPSEQGRSPFCSQAWHLLFSVLSNAQFLHLRPQFASAWVLRCNFWDRYGRRTVDRLPLISGMAVLDVCCGMGASAISSRRTRRSSWTRYRCRSRRKAFE
jgi:hypothetical protein